jgi:hypothetical protein
MTKKTHKDDGPDEPMPLRSSSQYFLVETNFELRTAPRGHPRCAPVTTAAAYAV